MRVAAERTLVAMIVATLAVPAYAESTADEAFRRGRDLFKTGQYPAACAEFEKSQTLDPQLGTLFNLGQCHEKIGKLASALSAYREVMAKDANAERRSFAADFAKKLAPRVPKIVVQVAGSPRGLVVRVDERRILANQPVEVDQGDYILSVHAEGMQDVATKVRINEERRTTTVIVPLTPKGTGEAALPTQRTELTATPSGSNRKLYGILTLAVGGVTLATGGVFGALAMRGWSDAQDVCGGATCATQADADRANVLRDRSISRASISNVLFVAGGVLAVTGVVLWATAPADREVRVSAFAGSDGASVSLSGHF